MNETQWPKSISQWQRLKSLLPYAFRAAVLAGPVAAISYWEGIYFSREAQSVSLGILAWAAVERFLYLHRQPRKMEILFDDRSGYYRLRLSDLGPVLSHDADVCFATRFEQDAIPEARHEGGIQVVGKIHHVVEGKFWVWKEM